MRSLRPLRPLQPRHPPCIPRHRTVYHESYLERISKRGSNRKRLSAAEQAFKKEQQTNADHRILSTELELFTTHESSPGSPLFHPNGTHIFQKLQAFLRAQYPAFGFREVVTPTIYKDSLWKQSGHWDNYKDDMFSVSSRRGRSQAAVREKVDVTLGPTFSPAFSDGRFKGFESEPSVCDHKDDVESGNYGLKPMNCPGHCLLFKSRKLSYRELPVRYADFSPLHRNEVSGSLSGLTRVRRFHQDDGHIFCRPSQVGEEIDTQLRFVDMVYKTFGMRVHELVLSTRPLAGKFIGKAGEWDRAEEQLKTALLNSGQKWRYNTGDGAFYGPKIDIILKDNDGKEHQTATIQLDFQLPQRFELEYEAPAPEQERLGLETNDPAQLEQKGMITPVMIHRAVLGSFERFMALLTEHHRGRWPFWLSPRQVIILAIGDNPAVTKRVLSLQKLLRLPHRSGRLPQPINAQNFQVDCDVRAESLAKKVLSAKLRKYNIVCVIGEKNLKHDTIDVNLSGIPDQLALWNTVEKIKPGSQAPVQKDAPAGMYRSMPGVQLVDEQLVRLMKKLTENYL